MKQFALLFLFAFLCSFAFAQSETEKLILQEIKEIKQEIKEIKQEQQNFRVEVEKRLTAVETRFEGVNQRFDEMGKRIEILLYVMIAILTGVFGLIGFVVWDRQVSLKPIKEDNQKIRQEIEEVKEKEKRLETALKSIASIDARFQEILKNTGIL